MNIKKIVGTATLAAALGAAALGLGTGSAQADPNWVDPNIPWIPGDWIPDWDPRVNWGVPPGQLKTRATHTRRAMGAMALELTCSRSEEPPQVA